MTQDFLRFICEDKRPRMIGDRVHSRDKLLGTGSVGQEPGAS
jgi:hypothetical protein